MHKRKESIAILIDGGFFLKRYWLVIDPLRKHSPKAVANNLYNFASAHVGNHHLYRIFYYDCVPFTKKVNNPITHRKIDFSKTWQHEFRKALFEELKKKRKVALRLGVLKDSHTWSIKSKLTKDLIEGKIKVLDFKENDISYDLRQKGIDMKIGTDIACLTLKKFATRIVLISGDADFMPASKLARTEGVDFILDSMWNYVDHTLYEHIDGLITTFPKPKHMGPPKPTNSPLTPPLPSPPVSANSSPASRRH